MKERFPHNRNPLTGMSVVSFGISEGNIIRKGKKKKKQQTNCSYKWRQRSGQTLMSTTSDSGLGREAWATS